MTKGHVMSRLGRRNVDCSPLIWSFCLTAACGPLPHLPNATPGGSKGEEALAPTLRSQQVTAAHFQLASEASLTASAEGEAAAARAAEAEPRLPTQVHVRTTAMSEANKGLWRGLLGHDYSEWGRSQHQEKVTWVCLSPALRALAMQLDEAHYAQTLFLGC